MKKSQKSVVSLFILAGYLAGNAACQMQAAQDYNVSTLAGKAGSPGSADGTGSSAQFWHPYSVAVDTTGTVYVADTLNNIIRQVGPDGVVTTLAGLAGSSGSADGTGNAARFAGPSGVAADSVGNLIVADSGNHTIRQIGPGGVVTTLAGKAGKYGSTDGTGSAALFSYPNGVAADSAGSIYVADSDNNTIRKIGPGGVVTTLAGLAGRSGYGDGIGSAARFIYPTGVAVDSTGNVYVADYHSHTIRQIGPNSMVRTLAAEFRSPSGVAVDSAGNVYVADSGNHTIRQIGPGGVVTTLAGLAGISGSTDGTGSVARFLYPFSVAVDSAGTVYVADTFNNTIRRLVKACPDLPTIDLVTGPVGVSRQLDTSFQTAITWHWQILQQPHGSTNVLSFPFIRNPVFIPDAEGQYIFQLSATNATGQFGIRTVEFLAVEAPFITMSPTNQTATRGDDIIFEVGVRGLLVGFQWYQDGLPLAGQTNSTLTLSNVQTSSAGSYTVVVSNLAGFSTSPEARLKVWLPVTVLLSPWSTTPLERAEGENIVFTAAASGAGPWRYQWSKNGVDLIGATNAQLSLASLRDSDTGQYRMKIQSETEWGSASVEVLVKMEYTVRTLAGLAGSIGGADGQGNRARFWQPSGVAVDTVGNVYVADVGNGSIRTIGRGGVVSTPAGLAGIFSKPFGVAVDSARNIYVADWGAIWKRGTDGVVTILAGKAGSFGSTDGPGYTARFAQPRSVAVDSAGNVYVADEGNYSIRQIGPGAIVTTLAGKARNPGTADGIGSVARFSMLRGVAVDSADNIYVADTFNHTIRQIGPDRVVTTLAGLAANSGRTDGTGSAARFSWPAGVAVDSTGNIYVADTENHAVRKLFTSGMVSTLAGLMGSYGSADGPGSTARFYWPSGVAVDSIGNIYVADSGNHTIRVLNKISPDRPIIDSETGPIGITRQLDTMPQQAARCAWRILQRPAGSTAELSSLSLRNPTFTPDKPGRYVFELATTDPSGAATTRTREFTAFDLGPIPPFSLRALRSGPTVVLAWTAASDYLLESAESLGSNAVWSPVPGVTTNTITLPLGVTNQYFRLRK